MTNPVDIHVSVSNSFDWIALIAAVASIVAGYIGGLTYRWNKKRHIELQNMLRFRLMQKLLAVITCGIQGLNEGYNSSELKTMVDAINLLNDTFMNSLQEILPEFVETNEQLLDFVLGVWDESIEIRERYAKPIQDINPSELWSERSEGVARETIIRTLSLLATKYRALSEIQAQEIDKIRPSDQTTHRLRGST